MTCLRFSRKRFFVLVVGLLATSPGAYAQTTITYPACMQGVYNQFNGGQTLQCTANDVEIAGVAVPNDPPDPCDSVGDTTTFTGVFSALLTAQARHDIGFYMSTNGLSALTGNSCLITILPFAPAPSPFTDLDMTNDDGMLCSGDNTRPCNDNLDCSSVGAGTCVSTGPGLQDFCGDIDNSPNPISFTLPNITLLCFDADGDDFLDVNGCTSWRQPGDNDLCRSPLGAFPGAPSKCLCQPTLRIPINVPRTIQVCKDLIPSNDPGLFNLQIDGTTYFADATDGNCTAKVAVPKNTIHSVGETAGTSTNLSDYDNAGPNIACFETVGRCTSGPYSCLVDANCAMLNAGTCNQTDISVGSCTNCTSFPSIAVGSMSTDIICTITNTNDCHDVCGNGMCQSECGEDCSTCPADCGCTPCTQACVDGVCQSTCGNGICNPDCENCETCPGDCGCNPCSENCVDGSCVAACGDGTCNSTCENCSNCEADCACGSCNTCVGGTCTPDCGDGFCDPDCGENCNSCESDCGCPTCQTCNGGVCTGDCGNGECQPSCGEDCSTCASDCGCPACTHNCSGGACVPACGDGTCNPNCENCSNCVADCGCDDCIENCLKGSCIAACGDGTCNPNCENCDNCPSDCGCAACTHCGGGSCVSDCGVGGCDPACENCSICPGDCPCPLCTHCDGGLCVSDCGDLFCDPACENCETCPGDCPTPFCTHNCVGGVVTPACGDGTCNPACENCCNCPSDCGCGPCGNSCNPTTCMCTPDCGDGFCNTACEDCNSCLADCPCPPCTHCELGMCVSNCGDGKCDPACENCTSCPQDCLCTTCTEICVTGECMSTCGDGFCDPACENCATCQADCGCVPCTQICDMGVCDPTCGDGACDPNCENCLNCKADCGCLECFTCIGGACFSDCGDGTCDEDCEDCGNCASDCPCDDGVACTNDSCQANACVFTPNDAKCTDKDFCNGEETCDAVLGCLPGDPNACEPPILTCPAPLVCECDAVVCIYGDPVLVDECSADPTFACSEEIIPGKLPQERTIIRTCTTTNDCGASDSCVQEIEIVDTTDPVITCPADVTCECGQPCETGEPIVSDTCNKDPIVTVEVITITNDCRKQPPPQTAGVSPPPKLIILNTYTVSDGATTVVATGDTGNTATCTQRVEIVDTVPPVLVGCSLDYEVCAGTPINFTPPGCTDHPCGECVGVICVRSDGLAMDAPMPESPLTITCTGTDECDLVSTCTVELGLGSDCNPDIPTVSEWGLIVTALLLLIGAKVYFGRREEVQTA